MSEKKEYYLLSLKHTGKSDLCLTFWRPKNCGYTYIQEGAGIYSKLNKGYHDLPGDTLPIERSILEKLFIESKNYTHQNEPGHVIPNSKMVWEELGLKMTNKGLRLK